MLNAFKMRIAQVSEFVYSSGWRSTFHELFFFRRTAVIIEKDLSEIFERPEPLVRSNLSIREIDQAMLESGEYRFAVKSRYYKAVKYLKQGCGGFVLVRDRLILGESWHWTSESTSESRKLHEDLRCFGFKNWNKADVYTFDMFVTLDERKAGVSAAFSNNVMVLLREKGFRRTIAFYWADNLRAYWCHRATNKWNEMGRVNISRFLVFRIRSPSAGKELHNHFVSQ